MIVNEGKNRFEANESNIKGSLGREKENHLFRLILVAHTHTFSFDIENDERV